MNNWQYHDSKMLELKKIFIALAGPLVNFLIIIVAINSEIDVFFIIAPSYIKYTI